MAAAQEYSARNPRVAMRSMGANSGGSPEDVYRTGPFPPEVLDRIIDFLWNEPAALAACACTSKQWLPSSTYYLYGDIRISPKTSVRSLLRAAALPRVASALSKSYALTVAPEDTPIDPFAWPHDRTPTPSLWNTLASLSALCPHIKTLHIGTSSWDARTSSIPRLEHLVFCCLGFVQVTQLNLTNLDSLSSVRLQQLLCALPALESVDFYSVRVLRVALHENLLGLGPSSRRGAPALRHVGTSGRTDLGGVSHWLRRGPTRDTIRSLALATTEISDHFTEHEVDFTEEERRTEKEHSQWIQLAAPHLQKLSLNSLYDLSDGTETQLTKRLLNNLTLYRCTVVNSLNLTCGGLQQALLVLAALSPLCRIQTLHLQLRSHTDTTPLLTALSTPQLSQLRHLYMDTGILSGEETAGKLPGRMLVAELAERYPRLSVHLTHTIVDHVW